MGPASDQRQRSSVLARRWWGLHVTVLLAVAACAALGWWQVDRAREQHAQSLRPAENAARPAVALDELLPRGARLDYDDVGRPVTVSGRYDAGAQLLVPDRDVDGQTGTIVLTPLVTDESSAILVARGWYPGGLASPPTPPEGEVVVTGWLGASEAAPDGSLSRPGEIATIHLASIVNLVPLDLRDGFVAATDESPPASGGAAADLEPLAAPTTIGSGEWPWRNLAYAAEWWLFGIAAVAFWVAALRRSAPSS